MRLWIRRRFADLALDSYEWLSQKAAMVSGSKRASRFGRFGHGSLICFPPQVIFNEHAISIGEDTIIGPRCSLTV